MLEAEAQQRKGTNMGKKQRSLLLDEKLGELVDAFQVGTGATFTRIVTAALLRFLLDDVGVDSRWMRYAVSLERADMTIQDVPIQNADDSVQLIREMLISIPKERFTPKGQAIWEDVLERADKKKAEWQKILLPKGKKTFDALLKKVREKPFTDNPDDPADLRGGD